MGQRGRALGEQIAIAVQGVGRRNHAAGIVRALFVKRGIDLCLAVTGIIFTAPLQILIVVLIGIERRGPVIFRQQRLGYAGKVFTILKFRTMSGPPDAPVVTKLGSFLRRSSLDELPQLFNVIAGDMSLVGPRPHAIEGGDLDAMVNRCHERLSMRPGLTGLAQVSGSRGPMPDETAARKRIAHDLAYVRTYSVRLDLQIIGLTVWREFISAQDSAPPSQPKT